MGFDLSKRHLGMVEMTAAMILSGSLGYFVVASGLTADQAVFYRCLLGAYFLGCYGLYRGNLNFQAISLKHWALCLFCGVAIPVNWVMLFTAYQLSSISISTAVYHTQPFFLLFLGVIFLRKRLSVQKILWILLAFIGVILAIDLSLDQISLTSGYVLGLLLSFGAAFLYAVVTLITMRLKAIKPDVMALIQMMVGAIVLLPFIGIDGLPDLSLSHWQYILLIGLVHTALKYILLYSALQKLKAPVVAVLSFIYPVVAIVIDVLFLDEVLTMAQILGVFMIVFSGYAISMKLPFPYIEKSLKTGRKKPPKSKSFSGV